MLSFSRNNKKAMQLEGQRRTEGNVREAAKGKNMCSFKDHNKNFGFYS